MTIDLKWGLPFALPFVLIMTARVAVWATGGQWFANEVAYASTFIGVVLGVVVTGAMAAERAKWNITIGGRK